MPGSKRAGARRKTQPVVTRKQPKRAAAQLPGEKAIRQTQKTVPICPTCRVHAEQRQTETFQPKRYTNRQTRGDNEQHTTGKANHHTSNLQPHSDKEREWSASFLVRRACLRSPLCTFPHYHHRQMLFDVIFDRMRFRVLGVELK